MSFRTTIVQGKTNHIDKDLLSFVKDLYDGTSGVVGSNGFTTTQSSPTAMSVTVGPGVIYSYISSATTYYRHELTDATTVLSIDTNSSGSTRIDLVCVKSDLTATPDANGGGIPSLVIVKGTPGAGVPSTPANHDKLYEVSVANGAATIVNANLTDRRNLIKVLSATLGSGTPDSTTFLRGDRTWATVSLGADGWLPAGETWTYASASTFTVSGDVTSKYQIGDKIKLNNSTTKYFYIKAISYSSPNTTITVQAGSDYSVANSAISSNYYSKHEAPQGFPSTFNWTPTWTGFSASPSSGTAKFKVIGRRCFVDLYSWSSGTSNSTGLSVSLPIDAASDATAQGGALVDQTLGNTFGYVYVSGSSAAFYSSAADAGWQNTGSKNVRRCSFSYPI